MRSLLRCRLRLAFVSLSRRLQREREPTSRSELIERAFDAAYNLDHAEAIAYLDKALAADPNDPDAHRAAAVIAWLRIGFLRGSITVDDYLGNVSASRTSTCCRRRQTKRSGFSGISRARWNWPRPTFETRPRDPDAHFRLGSIVGVQASYGATVEGKILASFRAAQPRLRRAREGARARSFAEGRRAHRRHLPLHRVRAVAAGASDGVRRRVWRRQGARPADDRGGGRIPGPDADRRQVRACCCSTTASADSTMPCGSFGTCRSSIPRNRQLWYEAGATLNCAPDGISEAEADAGRGHSTQRTPTGASGCSARTRCGTTSAASRARGRDRLSAGATGPADSAVA